MRQIKFRVWADNKMHYDNFSIEFNGGEMDSMIAYTKSDGKVVTCGDFVLEQFTGLKDSNDTEIYKGDIVKCDKWEFEVIRQKYGWGLKGIKSGWWRQFKEFETIEVIGNVHQKLIEDKENE